MGGLAALAGLFAFLYWKMPTKGIPRPNGVPAESSVEPSRASAVSLAAGNDEPRAGERGHVDERSVSKEKRRLLFADQSMKDELIAIATIEHELKPTLMLLDNLNCDRGLKEKNALLGDASAPRSYALLLDAYAKVTCGDRLGAIALLQKELLLALGASFPTLTTWHRLRALGVQPGADVAREVLALIIETSQTGGMETIAVYSDGNSSYADPTRSMYLPETRTDVRDAARQLVSDAAPLFGIAKKESDVERALAVGQMRVTFLTPSGPWSVDVSVSDVAQRRSEVLAIEPTIAAFRKLKTARD